MILHQDNKFIYEGIASVQLPSGMCIDQENSYEDSLQLVSPDGRLRLCVEFFTAAKSARELIVELDDPAEREIIFPIRAIKTPTGVRGYVITYDEGEDRYEEGTLDLGSDARFNYWLLQKTSDRCDYWLLERVKTELLDNVKIL